MNPYAALERLGIYALLMAALFFAGFYKGAHYEKDKWQAAENKIKADAFEQYKTDAEKIALLSAKLAATESKTNTLYNNKSNEVRHVIKRPVYSQCMLDADGMRLWNSANASGNASANASEFDAGVSHAAVAEKSEHGGNVTESR